MPGPGPKSELMYDTIRSAGGTIPIHDLAKAMYPNDPPDDPQTWRRLYHLARHLRDREGLEIWVFVDVALLGFSNYAARIRRKMENARSAIKAEGSR